jgi:hypothetical protein
MAVDVVMAWVFANMAPVAWLLQAGNMRRS